MDRKHFLKRAALAVGGLVVGRNVELPPAVASVPPPAVSATQAARNIALVASGGLCAPLSPFYDLPPLSVVRDALPTLSVTRGGIDISGS
jgi:hypothetical protein